MSKDDPFTPLASIRETGNYSSRNASKGAMLPELHRLLMAISPVYSIQKARELIFINNVLSKKTYENRSAIWHRLHHRYFQSAWIASCLSEAATSGIDTTDFTSLSYLYYALRDRLTYDFVTKSVWERWSRENTNISAGDFLEFINENKPENPELAKWRETTLIRLARNNLAALRDFGLLTGTAIKHIQRPTISAETVYHLLAILWAEGKRGYLLLQTDDWKLFLWNETETTDALIRLSQLGWIKFERGGQTVILEMIRMPEIVWEEIHGN